MASPHEPIDKEVAALSFDFLTPEEVADLSVLKISSPYVFDNLKQAVPGGLYDPALGPIDRNSLCATCHLTEKDCSGHMGHIELSVPVYHPLLFTTTYKLLRSTCMICHRFRLSRVAAYVYITKFRLLDLGRVLDCLEVDVVRDKGSVSKLKTAEGKKKRKPKKDGKKALPTKKSEVESDSDDEEEEAAEPIKAAPALTEEELFKALDLLVASGSQTRVAPPTALEAEYRQQLFAEVFASVSKRCPFCKGTSPGLRKDGNTKIFQLPLTGSAARANDALHLELANVLADDSLKDLSKRAGVAASDKVGKDKKPKKKHKGDEEEEAAAADSDGDESDSSIEERKGGGARKPKGRPAEEQSESSEDEKEEEKAGPADLPPPHDDAHQPPRCVAPRARRRSRLPD